MNDDKLIQDLIARVATDRTIDRRRTDLATSNTVHARETASEEEIAKTESQLDAPLPTLLRRVYLEVANGGIGPAYGLLGVAGDGAVVHGQETIVDAYQAFRNDPHWPRGLLGLFDSGCGQWTCLATDERAGVLAVTGDHGLALTEFTLAWFLRAWCDGRDPWSLMHEEVGVVEREGTNPFTKKPQVFRQPIAQPRGVPWPGYPRDQS